MLLLFGSFDTEDAIAVGVLALHLRRPRPNDFSLHLVVGCEHSCRNARRHLSADDLQRPTQSRRRFEFGHDFAHEKREFLKQNVLWHLCPVPDQSNVFARRHIIDASPSVLGFPN